MREKGKLKTPVFWAVYLAVIAVCVLLDQLSKHFLETAVKNNGGQINIIGEWLTLVWTTNDGATGGMFSKLEWRNILFFAMTVIGLPVFFFMLWRSRRRSVWGQIAFSFIIGGTIGNAIDRIFLAENGFFTGAVRDFVKVQNFFGIFNIADSFLVVGVIMALLAVLWFDYDSLIKGFIRERRQNAESNAEQTEQKQAESVSQLTDTAERNTRQQDETGNTDEKN